MYLITSQENKHQQKLFSDWHVSWLKRGENIKFYSHKFPAVCSVFDYQIPCDG